MAALDPSDAKTPEYLKNFPINPSEDIKQDYAEFQEIHNALHTLAYYLKFVRTGIVSSDTKPPNESIPFTKFLKGVALEKITEGNVVGPTPGGWRKGYSTSGSVLVDDPTSVTPSNMIAGKAPNFFGIALEEAEVGEEFLVGIGFAILEVTGVKCGQPVFMQSSRTTRYRRVPGDSILEILGYDWSGDGNLYLNRPFPSSAPGYPIQSNPLVFSYAGRAIAGVGVADNFMLFGQEIIHDNTSLGDPFPIVFDPRT